MTEIKFIIGKKEEIPSKYLEELFILQQINREEVLKYKGPTIEFFKDRWLHGNFPESIGYHILALDTNDKLIGYASASWNIKYDNLDKGYFWIFVINEERRKKIGTKLLREAVKIYPEQITSIVCETFDSTDALHFIKSFRDKENYIEFLSQSDLSKFDYKEVEKEAKEQLKKIQEKGYKIIFIENFNHILHVNFPKYVQMVEEIWNDMPREELTYEDDVLTTERYQLMIEKQLLMGFRILTFIAIHKETNEPVGLTSTYISKYQLDNGLQEDTGVVRTHRGNGLGLALKYQMLEKLLREGKVRNWRTGNAGSNEHMLRINKILKFEPQDRIYVFEFTKKELKEKLEL